MAKRLTREQKREQALVDVLDPLANHALVEFQLCLACALETDTTLLTIQMSPASLETGDGMFELCQLHLQLAFIAAGPLRENIQYYTGAIQHSALQLLLNVTFLAGRQRMIEEHKLRLMLPDGSSYLIKLP